jgi:predicted DNA-binding transcriptional regulator YafY
MSKEYESEYPRTQRDRLAYIELRLRFVGDIRRQDIIARFGIQSAAATRDLALYRELAPKNLKYDTKEKVYLYDEGFQPLFAFPAERVLTWLSRGYGDGYPDRISTLIPTDTAGPTKAVNLDTLSELTRAIHQKKAVSVAYHSLSSGQSTREFVPFALVDDGFRWHVRGFDRKRLIFLDLVITRIAEARVIDGDISEAEKPDQDIQWNRIVELELVPHPANIKHPDTIEVDYGMSHGVLQMRARAALVGYLLRRWNVDCSPDHRLRGMEYLLWLKNRGTLYGVSNLNLVPGYE